jgi:molecular chaperone DnaK
MYKAAAAAPPAEGAAGAGRADAAAGTQEEAKKDEGVIDAEYVDVDK